MIACPSITLVPLGLSDFQKARAEHNFICTTKTEYNKRASTLAKRGYRHGGNHNQVNHTQASPTSSLVLGKQQPYMRMDLRCVTVAPNFGYFDSENLFFTEQSKRPAPSDVALSFSNLDEYTRFHVEMYSHLLVFRTYSAEDRFKYMTHWFRTQGVDYDHTYFTESGSKLVSERATVYYHHIAAAHVGETYFKLTGPKTIIKKDSKAPARRIELSL